jgi:hypothetical protein
MNSICCAKYPIQLLQDTEMDPGNHNSILNDLFNNELDLPSKPENMSHRPSRNYISDTLLYCRALLVETPAQTTHPVQSICQGTKPRLKVTFELMILRNCQN